MSVSTLCSLLRSRAIFSRFSCRRRHSISRLERSFIHSRSSSVQWYGRSMMSMARNPIASLLLLMGTPRCDLTLRLSSSCRAVGSSHVIVSMSSTTTHSSLSSLSYHHLCFGKHSSRPVIDDVIPSATTSKTQNCRSLLLWSEAMIETRPALK